MTIALFQRSVSPILFDQVVELFTSDTNIAVYEYENVMREFLLGDFIARREVAGGRWFGEVRG